MTQSSSQVFCEAQTFISLCNIIHALIVMPSQSVLLFAYWFVLTCDRILANQFETCFPKLWLPNPYGSYSFAAIHTTSYASKFILLGICLVLFGNIFTISTKVNLILLEESLDIFIIHIKMWHWYPWESSLSRKVEKETRKKRLYFK